MENETLTTEAVMTAYQNLPADERRDVDETAEALMTGYQVRTGSTKGLEFASSVRLLGCLAVFLVHSEQVSHT